MSPRIQAAAIQAAVTFVTILFWMPRLQAAQASELSAPATLQATLKLLPRLNVPVVLVDPQVDVPESKRAHVSTLDAFVLDGGDKVVYVVVTSELFRAAQRSEFFRYVLATVIHHERAHLDGADEPTAMRAEEQLWQSFLRDARVAQEPGLKYLRAITARRR